MNMNPTAEPLVRVELYGSRPGSGDNWTLYVRNYAGATLLHSFGPRDVVLAAFAEFVEQLHEVPA